MFLNNTVNPGGIPPALVSLAKGRATVDSFWAAGGEFPESLDGYGGVILSGSPQSSYDGLAWIDREHRLIAELAERSIPMLGICFGSQILASSLFGVDQVFRRSTCEVGYKDLEVVTGANDDPVCGDLGKQVRMFVWHNDEVRDDHPRIKVLAKSDICPNQIWRHAEKPVWGVQGHLEITVDEAPSWFERNRKRLEADGADVGRLIKDADEVENAKTILARFLDISVKQVESPCDGAAKRPA
ncbi:type 1 glutamine amidotransferase [Limibacillus sp. MBR-115]|jgi:GMP synthase-like glutamine amidotransferase|uniref:type 1 glutamine amidotransferase n=1 Tax=Limibacillus sp. MBR-115 TaxID=3156465 RepID=UPI00339A85B0